MCLLYDVFYMMDTLTCVLQAALCLFDFILTRNSVIFVNRCVCVCARARVCVHKAACLYSIKDLGQC